MRRALSLPLLAALPAAALAQTPEDGRHCAQIAHRGPEHAAAAAHAERVTAGEPTGALAEFYRGCQAIAVPSGSERAAEHFERAVKLNDASPAAHDWLARAYGDRAQKANPFTQARLAPKIRTHFERAVALDPSNVDARAYLVQFYLQAPGFMGGSQQKAWQQIGELRRIAPYRAGMLAARTRLDAKDRAGGLQEYEALYAQYPDSAALASTIASMHSEAGEFDKAFAAVDRMLARHPDSRPALYALGRLAALSGQRAEEGERALARYIAMGAPEPGSPSLAHAHYRLGGVQERRGDRARARAAYETALKLDSKLEDAKRALAALR